jgi:hypothetical protein
MWVALELCIHVCMVVGVSLKKPGCNGLL